MFSQYFAQYILSTGILTTDQVQKALESERTARVKLGLLAINKRLMTAAQVEEVYAAQLSVDKLFGEIAIEKGYLALDQLADLLEEQECRHLNFGQAIIDKGFMNYEQLEQALQGYKEANHTHYGCGSLVEVIRPHFQFCGNDNVANIYCHYTALFSRAIMRFLDADSLICSQPSPKDDLSKWLITQNITGDINLHTGYYADDKVVLELARRFSGENLLEVDDLAIDSATEFLNVTNGLFCVNFSDKGLDLNLQFPVAKEGAVLSKEGSCCIDVKTAFGEIHLMMTMVR